MFVLQPLREVKNIGHFGCVLKDFLPEFQSDQILKRRGTDLRPERKVQRRFDFELNRRIHFQERAVTTVMRLTRLKGWDFTELKLIARSYIVVDYLC